ncbi:TBPIP-domain-containing protein [Trametes coccinea BRFM310]|uniref:TBPIP-domain-containing protein n=1 Tax=Trametes coccinea (strain BRFM310) TaxID=1353009 RepID=A0A1Y2I6E8_TRAC3|nr:TBPIP-domain-containing protein [Trametes coccinea BRFM310]
MASKPKPTDPKVAILKGKEAEDKVLEYIRKMNRPFGAVDVSANLKGAVPKAATQKIMVALAERGDLVQKTYGKTTFFVANQANLEDMPSEKLTALEAELKRIDEQNKVMVADLKSVGAELAKLKSTPTDHELASQVENATVAVQKARAHLEPLQAGTPLISAQETAQLDADWAKWRNEWIRRRKIFNTFWSLATDTLPPQQATELAEDLGVEFDTPEHAALERSELCSARGCVLGKRRR